MDDESPQVRECDKCGEEALCVLAMGFEMSAWLCRDKCYLLVSPKAHAGEGYPPQCVKDFKVEIPPPEPGDEEKGIVRADITLELEDARRGEVRCEVTGNPCGTDTWEVNSPCQCSPCRGYAKGYLDGVTDATANVGVK